MATDFSRLRGVDYEIAYWKAKLSQKGHKNMEDTEIEAAIAAYLPPGRATSLRILDVGCGPTFTIGGRYRGERLDLVGIDPLNDKYDKLLKELRIKRTFKTVTGVGEELLSHFEEDSFDLVFSKNALDHAQNPYEAIKSMVAVCKEGCCVVFTVFKNEALNANYIGFHQWNFSVIEKSLLFWNPGAAHILDECVDGLPYSLLQEKHPKSNRKYPIKITCVVHKPKRDPACWNDVGNGLYFLYNGSRQYVSLMHADYFATDERFFLHLLRNGKIVENISFQWDLRQRYKSCALNGVYADGLVLGQYVLSNAGGKRRSKRLWEKKYTLTSQPEWSGGTW